MSTEDLRFQLNSYFLHDTRPLSTEEKSWLQLFGRTVHGESLCIHVPLWTCVVLQLPQDIPCEKVITFVKSKFPTPNRFMDFVPCDYFALFHGKRDENGN